MGKKSSRPAKAADNSKQTVPDEPDMKEEKETPLVEQDANAEKENSLPKEEKILKVREQDVKVLKGAVAKKLAELNEKEIRLKELEAQAENGFPELFEKRFAEVKKGLKERERKCVEEWSSIEIEKDKLRTRELEVQKAEIARDQGYVDKRRQLEGELLELRSQFQQQLEAEREKKRKDLEEEIAKKKKARQEELEEGLAKERETHDATMKSDKDALERKKQDCVDRQASLDVLQDELEYREKRLQLRKEALEERERNLVAEIESKVEERKKSFELELSSMKAECSRLRESIVASQDLIGNFEELKRKLKDEDPAEVLLRLKTYEEEIRDLRVQLTTRPTMEMQETFDRMKSEKKYLEEACERLSEENKTLRETAKSQDGLQWRIDELEEKNKRLEDQLESIEAYIRQLRETLSHFHATYERGEERDERIKHIEKPLDQIEIRKRHDSDDLDELEWLSEIQKNFKRIGFYFPDRILKAFHTSLKTAEWSPLTVLAGVSGTGKSKLPELYAQFGGLNFLSTPVQPNWDSKESMLGFYNSIDNYFDAKPVLRFLAQTQIRPSEEYPSGLFDVMNLILLDEMNLAHIEQYFAVFLSVLEERRGRKKVPSIPVKIGAKLDPYPLSLGRNVLWVGTMNQDETTKSLSDKVLDRGVVINFPRPDRLERMKKLSDPTSNGTRLITRKQWGNWWAQRSQFEDDQIRPYKSFIEDMNKYLSKVGRALGHRVWQSVEYYMSNYPEVIKAQKEDENGELHKAMKRAFEDQLVQKVMPKLRGIETRGTSKTDCLDKIRTQLVDGDYDIVDDFDMACEFGYGQFMWNSAEYLKKGEPNEGGAEYSEEGEPDEDGAEYSEEGEPDEDGAEYLEKGEPDEGPEDEEGE